MIHLVKKNVVGGTNIVRNIKLFPGCFFHDLYILLAMFHWQVKYKNRSKNPGKGRIFRTSTHNNNVLDV